MAVPLVRSKSRRKTVRWLISRTEMIGFPVEVGSFDMSKNKHVIKPKRLEHPRLGAAFLVVIRYVSRFRFCS